MCQNPKDDGKNEQENQEASPAVPLPVTTTPAAATTATTATSPTKSITSSTTTPAATEESSSIMSPPPSATIEESKETPQQQLLRQRRHRGQRETYSDYRIAVPVVEVEINTNSQRRQPSEPERQEPLLFVRKKPKRQSKAKRKHGADGPSGGMEALLPSVIGLAIFACAVMAKLGFRGRAQVAGIDLGTTNSVVCVQEPSKGVGTIVCMEDPATRSPIIPSVVSFLEPSERPVGAKSKIKSPLNPHPSSVVVGRAAKQRINSHPHHTLYNAKRILGRPPTDRAIQQLQDEVEFQIHVLQNDDDVVAEEEQEQDRRVVFRVPHHVHQNRPSEWMDITPQQVGSYVVHALLRLTHQQLGHDMVRSAVICVPAKFDALQRRRTVAAFADAGVAVTRILEEPTAAALAYGLHQKDGVDYIVVYDFGGGTLDVSLLHVSNGFVDVMGSDGDDRLGGADFDAAIAHHWLEQEQAQQSQDDQTTTHHPHQVMVSDVSSVLHQLEQVLEDTPQHLDLEQELSSHCPAILEHPLCTVSSFHTLAEQLKIQLSNTYPEHLHYHRNDVDHGQDEAEAEEAPLEAHCLRLPRGTTRIPTKEDNPLEMVDAFCRSLTKTTLTLSRAEFQRVAQPLLERSIVPVQRLLRDLNIRTKEIDEVVMVGGTTRMPQIRELVRRALPDSQLNTHIDPDITVAYGAASVID